MNIPVNLFMWIMAFLPIAALLILMIKYGWGATEAAPVGLLITVVTGVAFYKADITLLASESAKGVWNALIILIIVWTAILMYQVGDEAKEKGIAVKVGKFIMSANGKSLITKEERGFIKIVAEEESGVIVGAQMMCARATDMIGEFVTAVANKLTVSQLLKGMRAHPTYNEGIGEALEELEGGAIHVMPKKKK